jgi:hypothetical protein
MRIHEALKHGFLSLFRAGATAKKVYRGTSPETRGRQNDFTTESSSLRAQKRYPIRGTPYQVSAMRAAGIILSFK